MTALVLLLLFFSATASSNEQTITEPAITEKSMTIDNTIPTNPIHPADSTNITKSAKLNSNESNPAHLSNTIDSTNTSDANPIHPADNTDITKPAKLNSNESSPARAILNSTTDKNNTSSDANENSADGSKTESTKTMVINININSNDTKTDSSDGNKPETESITTKAIDTNMTNIMAINTNTANSSITYTKTPVLPDIVASGFNTSVRASLTNSNTTSASSEADNTKTPNQPSQSKTAIISRNVWPSASLPSAIVHRCNTTSAIRSPPGSCPETPTTSSSSAGVFFGGVFTVLIIEAIAFAWMKKYHVRKYSEYFDLSGNQDESVLLVMD